MSVFVGCPGRMYDSRVFKHSFMYSKVQNLCDGGFHLIGDSAYPICPFLMTPYRDCGLLTVRQTAFYDSNLKIGVDKDTTHQPENDIPENIPRSDLVGTAMKLLGEQKRRDVTNILPCCLRAWH
ncbi:hypothetical protein DAPPUDRAFT_329400 [Daphnia pulex]|uniref:DDE Tnp4 domain-containing protein n=1 Tax=Daphnia pulex TaxID=6669 RepID=E9HGG7_DAPPU|nr:hypothetical protein DAPPUDRAFT_329400 [Daphnia pulex]|eukprot:EFX69150.1 hypothetical protein DAPPUDRAFT_329400 [Daphnia pulex]